MDNSGTESTTTTSSGPEPIDPYWQYAFLGVMFFMVLVVFLVGHELASRGMISEPNYSVELYALQCFLISLGIIIFFVPLILWTEYNYLNALKNNAENKWHDIDVQFKRRSALIPEYSTSVERFLQHENATLTSVMDARKHSQSAVSRLDKVGAEIALSGALRGLLAVVEAYPTITTHASIAALQNELANTENRIATYRLVYNSIVKTYNTAVTRFPTRFIARHFGFKETDYA